MTELSRARWATSLAFFANGVGVASWLARIPAMRDQAHLDERTLGFVLLAWALGSFVAFRVVGGLVARFGSGDVTRFATVGYCVALPLPCLAHAAWPMALWLGVVGFANGLLDVAMNAQAVAIEKRAGRPILSSFHAAFSFGGLIGAALGALAAHFAIAPFPHVAAIAVVLIAITRSRAVVSDIAEDKTDAPREKISKKALILGVVALCSSVGEGAMGDWTALFLRDVSGASEGVAALGYAGFSIAMTVGRLFGDGWRTRVGDVALLRFAGVAAALGTTAAVMWPTLGFVGFALVGLGLASVIPVVFSAAGNLPGVAPGAALSTVATLSYAGFLAGPPCIGILAHAVTLRFALLAVSALAVILFLLAGYSVGRSSVSST